MADKDNEKAEQKRGNTDHDPKPEDARRTNSYARGIPTPGLGTSKSFVRYGKSQTPSQEQRKELFRGLKGDLSRTFNEKGRDQDRDL